MLLTIHNLPNDIQYSDLKSMIQLKCGLTEVILDNLVNEGKTKKVTVGLAEEIDAALLARKMNGVYLNGLQLYVEDVRQKKASEQPYRSAADIVNAHNQSRGTVPIDYEQRNRLQSFEKPQQLDNLNDRRSSYQDNQPMFKLNQRTYENNQQTYQDNQMMYAANQYQMNQNVAPIPMVPVEYNMPYFMTPMAQTQTSFMNYSGVPQPVAPPFAEKRIQHEAVGFVRREANDQGNRSQQNEIYERRGRQRQTSPVRGQIPDETGFNKRSSRWGDSDAQASDTRRRNTLPMRGAWDSRDRYQDNTSFTENEFRAQQPTQSRRTDYPESDYFNRESSESSRQTGYGQRSTDRSEMFTANKSLVEQGAPVPDRPSRVFGSHATNPHIRGPAPSWDEGVNKKNRLRPENRNQNQVFKTFPSSNDWNRTRLGDDNTFQQQTSLSSNDRNRPRLGDGKPFQPRTFPSNNDRNRPRLGDDKPFQPRFPDRSGGRPPKSAENRRQQTINAPAFKRPYDNRDVRNEPQTKRIAGPNTSYSTPNASKSGKALKSPPATQITGRNAKQNSKLAEHNRTLVSLMAKDQTWRGQAAALIAKELLLNLELSDMGKKDQILNHLKKSVRSRIEVLLSDRLAVPVPEIVDQYRRKFPSDGDQAFFLAVLENISAAEEEKAGKKTHDTETSEPVELPAEKKKDHKESKAVPRKVKTPNAMPPKAKNLDLKPVSGSTKIPKYPNANKAVYKQQRQIQKAEKENEDIYQLAPPLQKALDEESDILCDLFMSACEVPDCEAEKSICERISDQAADDFRKVMKLNVAKRLLNITTSLMVRIFCHGKPPRREALEKYLKQFGAVSLKKCVKNKYMFVATLSEFEHFDHLCMIENELIDGTAVSFKPLHITGPPSKVAAGAAGAQRQKFIQCQIDTSGENLLEPHQPEVVPASTNENENSTGDARVIKTEHNEKVAKNDENVANNDSVANDESVADNDSIANDDGVANDDSVDNDDTTAKDDWGAGTVGWDDVTNNAGIADDEDFNVDNIKMEEEDLEDWV